MPLNSVYTRYAIVFVVALIFQATIVRHLEIGQLKPDLILTVLVMFAIQCGPNAGSTGGFAAGLVSDLMSGGLLGLGALSRSITGYAAAKLSAFFQEKSQFIFTLLICGIIQEAIYLYISTLGRNVFWWAVISSRMVNLLYTAIVGVSIYFLLSRWLKSDE